MKVLLVTVPFSAEERYTEGMAKVANVLPPLGMTYVAAVLEKANVEVKIIDSQVLNISMDQLEKQIVDYNPDFIGLYSMTPTFNKCAQLAKRLKNVIPKSYFVLGGPHASAFPKGILKESDALDYVIVGEGEITFPELVTSVEKGQDLTKVDGIALRKDGGVVVTNPRQAIQDLDSIPFPARHLLQMDKYVPGPYTYKRLPMTTMITTRGCPFRCTFCPDSVFGKTHRRRSVDNVIKEIRHLQKEYGIKEIGFYDDTLTLNKKWILELCDRFIEEKIDITWMCSSRVDTIDEEMLFKMKKAGCWSIFYGIESGNQELLDKIQKGITLDQVRKAVKLTHKAGIIIRASFMVALPGETPAKAMETIRFAIELDCKITKFNITAPYPGTELYEQALKSGKLEKNLDNFTVHHPVFVPYGYKDENEVMEIEKKAHRMFYFRPSYVLRFISEIRSWNDFKQLVAGVRVALAGF